MSNKRKLFAGAAEIWAVVLAVGFFVVETLTRNGTTAGMDAFAERCAASIRTDGLTSFVKALTNLGDTLCLTLFCVASIVLFAVIKRRFNPIMGVTALLSWGLNALIKNAFERPRPDYALLTVSGFSFPSGHAMNNMAAWVALGLCLSLGSARKNKIPVVGACAVYAVVIGLTRVYLGVHYFSDVLAGWFLGAAVALFVRAVMDRYAARRGGV